MNPEVVSTMKPIRLRQSQEKILRYRSGKMGILAVPGSGKTWTLSLLAAEIIHRGVINDGQEVLVVTLVNSAVDNFYQRVGSFIERRGLLPNIGYRVRTLHGLAHDIVRERPGLVGLSDKFQIIDERETNAIREEAAQAWMNNHWDTLPEYLDPELDEEKIAWIRREHLPDLVSDIGLSFIRSAKDQQLMPEQLRRQLDRLPLPLRLAEMGCDIYTEYQRALAYRGAVDFDDLIRLALRALETDHEYLERLQWRWPYILEDEAQDSSRLQEQILSKLSAGSGNWVRVGDPNQAIYETFTTATPRYLRDFAGRVDVDRLELPESGRSTKSIINLANYLVNWTMTNHPVEQVRDALHAPPVISPTTEDDPQPNPADQRDQVRMIWTQYTPQGEVKAVADSLERWLPKNPEATVAVLVPRNQRGFDLVNELRERRIPFEDGLLRSSSTTRFSAGALGDLLKYLADPQSTRKLARVYEVWLRIDSQEPEGRARIAIVAELLRKLNHVEDFLWPGPTRDWLNEQRTAGLDQEINNSLELFRQLVRRWQAAILLPIDQVILSIAQDMLSEPTELAVSHKLAVLLRSANQANPEWRLPDMINELDLISKNERRFLGFGPEEEGFNPDNYKGKAVVGTIHKAKGLEWDRVYLMSMNNYDFPSGVPGDNYLPERWFIRDHLNLEAEALAQLEIAFSQDIYGWYEEGEATLQARFDYVRERLRLMYVGITRARRELIVTLNTGRSGKQLPALPFVALFNALESGL